MPIILKHKRDVIMPFTLTRKQLYDLVWSEPLQRLGKQIGISDVELAKTMPQYRRAAAGHRLLEQTACGKARYEGGITAPGPRHRLAEKYKDFGAIWKDLDNASSLAKK
jgi:hypothetical protein